MGGSAKYRFIRNYIDRIKRTSNMLGTEYDEATARENAKRAYEEELRKQKEEIRKQEENERLAKTPKTLRHFDGHEGKSKSIYDNSSERARGFIDEGIQHLREAVDKLEFRRRINERTVGKILDSGLIKNQFETQTSMGVHDNDMRKEFSQTAFQYDEDLAPADYEKYGYLGNGDYPAFGYGDMDIVFKKDALMDRTTITYGDSLFPILRPSRVTNPGIASLYGSRGYDADYMRDTEAERFKQDAYNLATTGKNSWGYAELQYHGLLTTNDIDHFSVPKYWKDNPSHEATIRRIEAAGFKVTYDDSK